MHRPALLLCLLALFAALPLAAEAKRPIPIKVVILTTFEQGERRRPARRVPVLGRTLPPVRKDDCARASSGPCAIPRRACWAWSPACAPAPASASPPWP